MNCARIEVSDTGTGIEEENLERIWKPFERFSTSSPGGSGLGLTITRLLVDAGFDADAVLVIPQPGEPHKGLFLARKKGPTLLSPKL